MSIVLNALEKVGEGVERVGKHIPGYEKFDKAMQVVADKVNEKLGLSDESQDSAVVAESGLISGSTARSDSVTML